MLKNFRGFGERKKLLRYHLGRTKKISDQKYVSDDQLSTLLKLVWAVKDGGVAAPAPAEMVPTQREPFPKQGASANAKVKAKAKPQAKAKGKLVARGSGEGSGQKRSQHNDLAAVPALNKMRQRASSKRDLVIPLEDQSVHIYTSDSEF